MKNGQIGRRSGAKAFVSEASAERNFYNGRAESVRYSTDKNIGILSGRQRPETVSNMTMKTLLCNLFMSERFLLASVLCNRELPPVGGRKEDFQGVEQAGDSQEASLERPLVRRPRRTKN